MKETSPRYIKLHKFRPLWWVFGWRWSMSNICKVFHSLIYSVQHLSMNVRHFFFKPSFILICYFPLTTFFGRKLFNSVVEIISPFPEIAHNVQSWCLQSCWRLVTVGSHCRPQLLLNFRHSLPHSFLLAENRVFSTRFRVLWWPDFFFSKLICFATQLKTNRFFLNNFQKMRIFLDFPKRPKNVKNP